MPPPCRNHLPPAAWDTPTAAAASSASSPFAISRQNRRSTSRRSAGAPGDFIGDRPVNVAIHPAGLPIDTSENEVLQRPVESAQYISAAFADACRAHGIRRSMGRIGSSYDNAMAESFFATLKRELLYGSRRLTRSQARTDVFSWLAWYNRRRRHSALGYRSPIDFEHQTTTMDSLGLVA